MASKQRLKTAFRKAKTIAPLHTSGPVAITKDGCKLLTCVGEQILCTDNASGQEICRFKGDNSTVTSLAVSPSSTHVAIFYSSLTLRLYQLPPGNSLSGPSSDDLARTPKNLVHPVRTISKCHDAPVHVCCIDPSSTLLASGSADGVVKVWDMQRGYVTHMFKGHGGVVSALAFNYPRETSSLPSSAADARMQLITGSADTRIRIFDLTASFAQSASAKAQDVLEGHVSVPRGLSVTADGRWLVSGGRDAVVIIWDLGGDGKPSDTKGKGKAVSVNRSKPRLVKTIPVLERIEAVGVILASETVASPTSVTTTAGRLRFYTGGEKGAIRIWDATEAEVIATLGNDISEGTEDPRGILDVIYTPSTSTITSIHGDQNIVSYCLPTGRLSKHHIGFNDEIVDARLLSTNSPALEDVIALATNSPLIRIYNTSTLDARLLPSHADTVLCLDATSDGTILASAGKDKSARLWTLSSASDRSEMDWCCVAVAEGHAESIGALALSRKDAPSPQFMFTGSQDRTVKMWDITNIKNSSYKEAEKLKSLLTLKIHDKGINSLDVAPNDKLLATGSQDKTANIYEIEFVSGAKPKGSLNLLGTCKGHKRGVWCAKFSRTERFVATASGDKSIKLWSLDDFSCLKTFEGHTNTVLRVDFITQGHQLVSTASDGLVKIWTIKDEECVASLDNHEDKIWALAISRDESTIISGGADSIVTFWTDCTEEMQIEKGNARAEMILKEQDLQNFVQLRDYRSAIILALAMNQPGRLLSLFTNVRKEANSSPDVTIEDATSLTGSAAVDAVIATLGDPELVRLLMHVRDWNTTARTSEIAQGVLHAVLKLRTAEDIMRAFQARSTTTADDDDVDSAEDAAPGSAGVIRRKVAPPVSLKELIDSLLPYTERHLARADKLVQDSYAVDYILSEMDMGMLALDDRIDVDVAA